MFNLHKSNIIKVRTVGEKRIIHQNGPKVGTLCKEHQDMVTLAISVGDVMCAVKLDTECLTVLCKNDEINVVHNTMDFNEEHALMADMWKKYNELKDSSWLCYSGATCHLRNDHTGVYDIIKINKTTIFGDGNGIKITKKGKSEVKVEQNYGSTCDSTFDVKVLPEVPHQQLLSLTMVMQEGWKITTV